MSTPEVEALATKLAPCWNCRSRDVYLCPASGDRSDAIVCNGCEMVLTGSGWDEARVLAAWNRRATTTAEAMRERAAKVCDDLKDWADAIGETASGNALGWARTAESLAAQIRALKVEG